MLLPSCLLALTFASIQVYAQLSLPSPPWLPANASAGAVATTGSNTSVPNEQWSTLLGDLLYFYEAQRSGKLPSNNRVSWRNDSATSDGSDVGLDLTGGYYDAGDYIKVSFPLSFTLNSICWGGIDFGMGYDLSNQTSYLDSMLRWGLDWLIKMHANTSTLYVEVADTGIDNAYWGGDQNIPGPRPSFQINDTSPGTDAAAGVSAAFASCSYLYYGGTLSPTTIGKSSVNSTAPASLKNTTYADTLLIHAVELYELAVNASGGMTLYQNSVPEVQDSYASSGYGDELVMAGLWLSLAVNASQNANSTLNITTLSPQQYYSLAESYYSQFDLAGQNSVFNWDDKTAGTYILFAQMSSLGFEGAGNFSQWQTEAERYLDVVVDPSSSKGDASLTKGGLLYYSGDSDDASLNPALNAAMLLTRYAASGLCSTNDKKATYLSFAQSQLDYTLGNNPMFVPYIVGLHPNSPINPHSAMSSGGDDIGQIDTSPPLSQGNTYVLYGAVVGGPDRFDRFFDIRSDWVENEVALDYNAPMLTLTAMHIVTDDTDPYFTQVTVGANEKVKPKGQPCDDAIQDGCSGHRLSEGGEIALGVVLGVVGLVVVGLLAVWLWKLRSTGSFGGKA
ncbi:MAG: glycoside hydrolase family 9 protein [Lentinula lateritia]|uniref:Endoglucanase n=1 Tax=Lentinula lateritia TaxID=40482 RepID=A0ABQ8VDA7_9AGAR|nr:MAG: glycoside hydrolase family 9 protein [Lentinula lateritia]KAJ4482622.1 glycoside hydrolase family 9 protein [Lentinula lateritia]